MTDHPSYPEVPPIYDIEKTYLENLKEGPFFDSSIPARPLPNPKDWTDFLGVKLASPIGVPAGPLLDSKWIALASSLGYDLVAYKTIRSRPHQSHPLPNILPVKTKGQLIPGDLPEDVTTTKSFDRLNDDSLGITNSFGNPSMPRDFLRQDIPKAQAALGEGQAMIVSIFGSANSGADLFDDFVEAARFAKECGARLIEANYSCPNVATNEGTLFSSPETVRLLSKRIIEAIGDIPLIIKVGLLEDSRRMREALLAAARAGVQAVCGLNTISMKVNNSSGAPALGKDRPTSGVCGNPIRNSALLFTRQVRDIIDSDKLDLKLMATGGVSCPDHFRQFLNEGADIVMTATGMMWDPYLAMKYHSQTIHEKETLHA